MPRIAAFIRMPDIHDLSFRMRHLCFQRSNERVFGIDDDVIHLTFQLESDSKPNRLASSTCSIQATYTNLSQTSFGS